MTESFDALLAWIEQNPGYAGWVVFGVALAESLAIVGVLVPGVVILFGAGTLIGAGVLDFWSMCAWAIAGAVIGDSLSFWLGHHFEYLTERWRWFRLHPDHLQRGVEFFRRYGDLSIALGRFFGPLRAIVPLVAGLMRMSPRRFLVANVLSALVWAPAYLMPGMLVGELANGGDWHKLLFPAGAVALIVLAWLVLHRLEQRRATRSKTPE